MTYHYISQLLANGNPNATAKRRDCWSTWFTFGGRLWPRCLVSWRPLGRDIRACQYVEVSWGTPVIIHFCLGFFLINQPFLGILYLWNPPCQYVQKSKRMGFTRDAGDGQNMPKSPSHVPGIHHAHSQGRSDSHVGSMTAFRVPKPYDGI